MDDLFRFEDEETNQPAQSSKGTWQDTKYAGVQAEASKGAYRYEREGETTILPLVLDYGQGIKGAAHAYGDIKTGQAYVGDEKGNPVPTGDVEPVTRIWEKKAEDSVIIEPDIIEAARSSDYPDDNDKLLEKMTKPKKTLKYTLKGKQFGRLRGTAELISVSEDSLWVGIVFGAGPDQSEFTPPVNTEE